jgi:hypothetical protein
MIYADRAATAAATTATADAELAFPSSQTFTLHSRPGSAKVVYLDFDGDVVTSSGWQEFFGFLPIAVAPFDRDSTPATFSDGERAVIQSIWQRVTEDFAPFDVDVTTEAPSAAALTKSGPTDSQYGIAVLIGRPPDPVWCAAGCGLSGAGNIGAFSESDAAKPAFVWDANGDDLYSAKQIGEIASHETGHTFGLRHDGFGPGFGPFEYYFGHGAWAPIMGTAWNRPISQWSKGEYSSANNLENDFGVIGSQLGLVPDEAGSTVSQARQLAPGPAGSVEFAGNIRADLDADWFKFDALAGPATFAVRPAPVSPNLDVELTLGQVVPGFPNGITLGTVNPLSAGSAPDLASGLDASLTVNLPSPGTYYVAVQGVGAHNPASTGYSGYGSMGNYTLSINVTNDGDSVPSASDNCPTVANQNQADNDGDAQGDACDPNDDNDAHADTSDNCELVANDDQADDDGDAQGDACDPDDDNDGRADGQDNCQFDANPDQGDADGDGVGTACDSVEMPATAEQCKDGGWKAFHDGDARFKNQGDCVSWARTNGPNGPTGPK